MLVEAVRRDHRKQDWLSQKTADFETHQTVGFGTHGTVDGDARRVTRPAEGERIADVTMKECA